VHVAGLSGDYLFVLGLCRTCGRKVLFAAAGLPLPGETQWDPATPCGIEDGDPRPVEERDLCRSAGEE
jgi:hypothetical protein